MNGSGAYDRVIDGNPTPATVARPSTPDGTVQQSLGSPMLLSSPGSRHGKRRYSQSDRFIPDRSGVNYATAYQLNGEPFSSPTKSKNKKAASGEYDAVKDAANRVYAQVLKNEMFGPMYADPPAAASPSPSRQPTAPSNNHSNHNNSTITPPSSAAVVSSVISPPRSKHSAMLSPRKVLQFRPGNSSSSSDRILKSARRLDFSSFNTDTQSAAQMHASDSPLDSPLSPKYSVFPCSPLSVATLQQPRKTPRYIAKVPYKVLDAPDLADDFYLNLVDWGSGNVLGVGLGNCVYLWSACTSRVTKLCDMGAYDSVTSVNWIQKGSHVAVGTNRGLVQIWDAAACKKVRTMTGHTARVGTLAWNEHVLTSGSRDRLIYHRDVRSQEHHVKKLSGHKQEVCGLKWNSDDGQLASGGNDNRLFVWDRMMDQPLLKFTDHTAAVKAIAWSPHQRGLLASGGGTADRRIRFWNTVTGQPLQCIDTGSQVCNLAWSKTANEIVSTHGYSQNQISVWKYPSMQQIGALTGHSLRVLYLAMSPDGQSVVTGAGDETLRFWNVFNKSVEKHQGESVLGIGSSRSLR